MRYPMEDGTVIDTENAARSWDEVKRWNGSNNISVATGNQWNHETLYRSRKGRYYVEHSSEYEDHAEWMSPEEAIRWLLLNKHDLPEELKQYKEAVTQ